MRETLRLLSIVINDDQTISYFQKEFIDRYASQDDRYERVNTRIMAQPRVNSLAE